MADPKDPAHRSPLSSSSSNTAGTQALSVTIEAEPVATPNPPPVEITPVSEVVGTHAPELNLPGDALESADGTTQYNGGHETAKSAAFDAADEALKAATFDRGESTPEIEVTAAPAYHAYVELLPALPPVQPAKQVRHDVHGTLARNVAGRNSSVALFEQTSVEFKTALDEAGQNAARMTLKLMEFAQANASSNLAFARDCAAVRSVPEIFDVQAAYVTRQMKLMTAQAEELGKLSAEITAKSAAPFKRRVMSLTAH